MTTTTTKWNRLHAGSYTNNPYGPFDEEWTDWVAANPVYEIRKVEGPEPIGSGYFESGTWVVVVDQMHAVEFSFARLTDAKTWVAQQPNARIGETT